MPRMQDATVRQLEILASAARTLSFTRTSAELHLTQPAVSMQIRQLEYLAGTPLFERVGRKLFLTEAGAEMAKCAQRVLGALQDAEQTFAAIRGLKQGHIHVGVVSTAKYFAPRLLAMFAHDHPEIEIRLSVSNRGAVGRMVIDNEIDFAIMGRPPRAVDTVATPFARHPFVIIAPPKHPLTRRQSVSLGALAKETFLVREQGSGTRAAMEQFFSERGLTPRIGMEMGSNETIKQAVMAGMGLSFISLHTVGLELKTKRLALVHAPGLPVYRDWHVVHRVEKVLSPAAKEFRAFVLERGATLLASWPAP